MVIYLLDDGNMVMVLTHHSLDESEFELTIPKPQFFLL